MLLRQTCVIHVYSVQMLMNPYFSVKIKKRLPENNKKKTTNGGIVLTGQTKQMKQSIKELKNLRKKLEKLQT